MAYNTNTKLLLNFNGSNGDTSTSDTSQSPFTVALGGAAAISSAQGKFSATSLVVGDPLGSGSVGELTVTYPASLFSTSTSSAKRFDGWFYRESLSSSGNGGLIAITFANNDTLMLWRGATSIDVEFNSYAFNTAYNYGSVANYQSNEWCHIRLYIAGDTLKVGLDGAEIISIQNSLGTGIDLWEGTSGNPVTEIRFGAWPSIYSADSTSFFRGYFDSFELTEGDTSWTGGSYTVPTAQPDDYVGGGPVTIYGDGSNTLESAQGQGDGNVTSVAVITGSGSNTLNDTSGSGIGAVTAPPVINGVGANTLDATISIGSGSPEVSGAGANSLADVSAASAGSVFYGAVGANTLDSVTGKGFGGTTVDIFTTLSLHGSPEALLVDSSFYNNTATGYNLSSTQTPLVIGNGAFLFPEGDGGTGGGELLPSIQPGNGLFYEWSSNKVIDFVIKPSAGTNAVRGVLGLAFPVVPAFPGSTSSINLLIDTTNRKLTLSVVVPAVNTSASTANATITLGVQNYIRLAFIGSTVYLCINGIQRAAISGSGNIWPTTVHPTQFSFGSRVSGFLGALDEIRVQEGTAHGYTGGNYTPTSAEWWPAQIFGQGNHTLEAVQSVGSGIILPEILGAGANTLDDTTNDAAGAAGVFITGIGANTLDAITVSHVVEIIAPGIASGSNTVSAVTSNSAAILSWAGRGSNALDAILSDGVGAVVTLYPIGAGSNALVDIVSAGRGAVRVSGQGANSLDAVTSASPEVPAYANGQSTTSVSSVGTGQVVVTGRGSNTLQAVFSVGRIAKNIQGAGAGELQAMVSVGAGAAIVSGIGSCIVEDVMAAFVRYEYPYMAQSAYVLRTAKKVSVTTRNNSVAVMQ